MSGELRSVRPARVALIALGNRLRGDDALGPVIGERVAERLRRLDEQAALRSLTLHCGPLDAMAIVAAWSEAQCAFVVDAALSGVRPGTLHRFEVMREPRMVREPRVIPEPNVMREPRDEATPAQTDEPHPPHRGDATPPSRGTARPLAHALARSSSHGLGLAEAIGLARALGRLPERLVCYAIEAQAFGHAQGLSREVDDALEDGIARIADEILATWHDRRPLPRGACGD